jgi:Berberine and berberine like
LHHCGQFRALRCSGPAMQTRSSRPTGMSCSCGIGRPAYISESNFFEKDWQRSYWGTNYERLRAIKRQYDPDGLFLSITA